MEPSNSTASRIGRDLDCDATTSTQGGYHEQSSTSATDETPLLEDNTGDAQYGSSNVVGEQETWPGEADFAGLPWTKRPSVS
jgi:hypothetical protein